MFRHFSDPIQHLWRSGRSGDHDHLWFRSIRVRVVRYDSHSASDTDWLFSVRHSVKLKKFHVLHAHRARGKAIGELEGLPGADKINRLSPAPYDEGHRYLAVGWRNELSGRDPTPRRRHLAKCQPRKKYESEEKDHRSS